MTTEEDAKYNAWLERLFAEHVSKENLGPGDIRRRVSGTMSAVSTLRRRTGDLFGLNVKSMTPELLGQLSDTFGGRFEDAVVDWRIWLEHNHGPEGAAAFRKIGENCGYFEVPFEPLARSSAVDAAFAELLHALDDVERATTVARARGDAEDDESIGYYTAPPSTDAQWIADIRPALPPQVQGLYAILDTLDIFATPDEGGRSDTRQSDYVLIHSLVEVEDVSNDDRGIFSTLHAHDMGRFLCFNPKGELWSWDRFAPQPKLVAPDVATYLRDLAAKYRGDGAG